VMVAGHAAASLHTGEHRPGSLLADNCSLFTLLVHARMFVIVISGCLSILEGHFCLFGLGLSSSLLSTSD